MKTNFGKLLVIVLLCGFFIAQNIATSFALEKPKLIAHAGGIINNITYSSSLEALDTNYARGHRHFELDFNWTLDNKPVLIHDWDSYFTTNFQNVSSTKVPTLKEFKNLTSKNNLTHLDLPSLISWIKSHNDTFIITDVKERNIEFLKLLKKSYPSLYDRFIPQAYSFKEYNDIKNLGYQSIILTLYKLNASNKSIIDFAKVNKLYAVTMPQSSASTGLPAKLKEHLVSSYVHTVNFEILARDLMSVGVDGVYTDKITYQSLAKTFNEHIPCISNGSIQHTADFKEVLAMYDKPFLNAQIFFLNCLSKMEPEIPYFFYSNTDEIHGNFTNNKNPIVINIYDDNVVMNKPVNVQKLITHSFPANNASFVIKPTPRYGVDPSLMPVTAITVKYSRLAAFLLILKTVHKTFLQILIFTIPVILLYLSFYKGKSFKDGFVYYATSSIVSLELYFGYIYNDLPLTGFVWTGFISYLIFYIILHFSNNTTFKKIILASVFIAAPFYFIGTDIYYQFFKDYPTISVLGYSQQVSELLDAVKVLYGFNHTGAIIISISYMSLFLLAHSRHKDNTNPSLQH